MSLINQTIIKRGSLQYALWYVFDRLWLVTGMVCASTFGGTLWLSSIYSLFGASIGQKTFLEDTFVRLPFMLTIKDGTVVEADVKLETIRVLHNGDIEIGRIVLESNVVVGSGSFVGYRTKVGSYSILRPLSRLPSGNTIKKNCVLEGHRLRERIDDLEEASLEAQMATPSCLGFTWHLFASLLVSLSSVVQLGFNAFILLILVKYFQMMGVVIFVCCLPLVTAIASLVLAVFVIHPIRYLMLGGKRASPMETDVYSINFHRYWIAIKLYHAAISAAENTILSRFISKLLGADVDIHAAFSLEPQEPHLTLTGKNFFCGNGVKFRNIGFSPGGRVNFDRVEIGDNCMIFDRSVVEAGVKLENNVLVGSVTVIPKDIENTQGNKLIGNPLIKLRLMADMATLDEPGENSANLFQEVLSFVISTYWTVVTTFPVITAYLLAAYFFWRVHIFYSLSETFGALAFIFPFIVVMITFGLLFVSYIVKALFIGNFQTFLGKGEVAGTNSMKLLKWRLANMLISSTCRIPLLVMNEFWLTRSFWRLMGAKIGENTMIDPDVLLFEADMVEIGKDCRIEEMATLLCHKFNQGNLEMEPISIPNDSVIRSHAVILPGSKITGKRVKIMPLTHVLPGEDLSDGVWHGSPAEIIDIEDGIV